MGIWAETAKTIKHNNSMLRGKTLFKVIGDHITIEKYPTKIDPKRMEFGIELVSKRKKDRSLVFFLIIYPWVLFYFFVQVLWLLFI